MMSVKTTTFPLDFEFGSDESIIFLEGLEDTKEEVFYSTFNYLLEYKWRKDSWKVKLIAWLFCYHTLLIDLYVVYFLNKSMTLWWVILPQQIFFIIFEVCQVRFFGWSYFRPSEWVNILDVVGQPCILLYCIDKLELIDSVIDIMTLDRR